MKPIVRLVSCVVAGLAAHAALAAPAMAAEANELRVARQPGAIFSATPQRSMLWADYMARIGLIKQKPASWKDYTFPNIYDRNGS